MINLKSLRELAMKATEGKWEYTPETAADDWQIISRTEDDIVWVKQEDSGVSISRDDGEYIAASNPSTIIELLDTLESLQSDYEGLKGRFRRVKERLDLLEKVK